MIDLLIAHGTSLLFNLIWLVEPFNQALIVEEMSAGGDFPDLFSIVELNHANDTLVHVKLIYIFVVLSVLKKRNQFFIDFNGLLV